MKNPHGCWRNDFEIDNPSRYWNFVTTPKKTVRFLLIFNRNLCTCRLAHRSSCHFGNNMMICAPILGNFPKNPQQRRHWINYHDFTSQTLIVINIINMLLLHYFGQINHLFLTSAKTRRFQHSFFGIICSAITTSQETTLAKWVRQ